MRVYYFGCWEDVGHYMRSSSSDRSLESCRAEHDFMYTNPWGTNIDGGLCPKGPQNEGAALVHQKDGWTALSFWDRSVDSRLGSNSNFLAEGTFDLAQMIAIAKEHFPTVMERIKFKIY
jgi:hypothetical protein